MAVDGQPQPSDRGAAVVATVAAQGQAAGTLRAASTFALLRYLGEQQLNLNIQPSVKAAGWERRGDDRRLTRWS